MKKPTVMISVPCPHCGQMMRVVNGLWLRERRVHAGIDQRAFGKLAGKFSGPYISDIERNRRVCPDALLAAYRALPEK